MTKKVQAIPAAEDTKMYFIKQYQKSAKTLMSLQKEKENVLLDLNRKLSDDRVNVKERQKVSKVLQAF